jgi:hypothetical protein
MDSAAAQGSGNDICLTHNKCSHTHILVLRADILSGMRPPLSIFLNLSHSHPKRQAYI